MTPGPDVDESSVAEPGDGYDEEQWKKSFAGAESAFAEAGGEPGPHAPDEEDMEEGEVPALADLVAKISPRNHELLEGLFRGRFVSVQPLNRKKLH